MSIKKSVLIVICFCVLATYCLTSRGTESNYDFISNKCCIQYKQVSISELFKGGRIKEPQDVIVYTPTLLVASLPCHISDLTPEEQSVITVYPDSYNVGCIGEGYERKQITFRYYNDYSVERSMIMNIGFKKARCGLLAKNITDW